MPTPFGHSAGSPFELETAVKHDARALALQAVKWSAASADWMVPPPRGVVALQYHRVGRRAPLEIDLPIGVFEEQMALLADERRTTTLDRALELLAGAAVPERDPVVVTFDDGTADFADSAAPVLVRYGIPVVLYLATAFVEHRRPFPHEGVALSWAALRDLVATGLVTVGSHTHTHALLDRADASIAATELDASIGLLRERLGVDPRHFAYPKGAVGSPPAAAAVRRRFASAALADVGVNRYGRTDPYRLARSPIQLSDGMRWFARKLHGGLALEGTLRRALNNRRYAGLVS
jgi:peptidoglycan/xylan/chitin deacetylase (PgdA/CDA1 family)